MFALSLGELSGEIHKICGKVYGITKVATKSIVNSKKYIYIEFVKHFICIVGILVSMAFLVVNLY